MIYFDKRALGYVHVDVTNRARRRMAGPRILARPLAGGPDRVLAYAPGALAQAGILQSGTAVNSKTGEIIYVAVVQSDTNIDLLTTARR